MSRLDAFPLAWRWTQLSAEERGSILPLDAAGAAQAYARAVALEAPGGPIQRWDAIELSWMPPAEIGQWLDQHAGDEAGAVVLSWDRQLVVQVPWALFRRRWDDFCYPSSDDVTIFPADERWALVYRHFEQFEFGRRAV